MSRVSSRLSPVALTILTVSILASLFALSLRTPVRPAEATAAIAALESCHTGEANIAHQLGQEEPRRLPLQTWILSAIARGQPQRVSVTVARFVSFLAIVVAALVAAAAFGAARRSTLLLIVCTPAVWFVSTRGTPGALLAALITLAWAAYESGRRLGVPSLQWVLPLILGAVASLLWAPAILLVALMAVVEALRLAGARQVAWTRLILGAIGALLLIGAWRMAYSGFAVESVGWWPGVLVDFWPGDPVLAARETSQRLIDVVLAWAPVLVLLVARKGKPGTGPAAGILVSATALALFASLAPGIPTALLIPPVIVALVVLARGEGSAAYRKTERVLVVFLPVMIAAIILHTPRSGSRVDVALLGGIAVDDVVVVDREVDVLDTWRIVRQLGRPARRAADPEGPAWYIGLAPVGPGLKVERPVGLEGWSLLARPLTAATLPADTRLLFESKLGAAIQEHESSPGDVLKTLWVGRRMAYLGRYLDAIKWYGNAMLKHPDDSRLWRHRGHRYLSVRKLEQAIDDLEYAARLEQGRADRVEPDGLPNAAGIPTSTTQTNIWYHLGLAYYLKGDFEQTARCYREYLARSTNDDSWVAGAHWLHIALRRLGRDAEATELLLGLHDEMTIIENHSYHDLVRLYAGRLSAERVQERLDRGDGPSQAALAYGLARWYEDNGDAARAHRAYERIVAQTPWAAFGAIAAEAEIASRLKRELPVW